VGGNPVNFVDPSGLSVFSEFKDYLTAADAEKAADDSGYNNRFSNAEATAAAGVRDAGEFLAANGPLVASYVQKCLQRAAELGIPIAAAGAAFLGIADVVPSGADAVIGCGIGIGEVYVSNFG
jgi:hypothetical protein